KRKTANKLHVEMALGKCAAGGLSDKSKNEGKICLGSASLLAGFLGEFAETILNLFVREGFKFGRMGICLGNDRSRGLKKGRGLVLREKIREAYHRRTIPFI